MKHDGKVKVDKEALIEIEQALENYFKQLRHMAQTMENQLSFVTDWSDADYQAIMDVAKDLMTLTGGLKSDANPYLNSIQRKIKMIEQYEAMDVGD